MFNIKYKYKPIVIRFPLLDTLRNKYRAILYIRKTKKALSTMKLDLSCSEDELRTYKKKRRLFLSKIKSYVDVRLRE